jgi:ubiquinone/menaquinone biosynthesis C-methylase UbiE
MPLADQSLGAVFASAILRDQHDKALAESFRVLEPGGLVFWQNGQADDLQVAQAHGFEVVRAMSTLLPKSRPQLSFVFQKPTEPRAM